MMKHDDKSSGLRFSEDDRPDLSCPEALCRTREDGGRRMRAALCEIRDALSADGGYAALVARSIAVRALARGGDTN